MEKRRPGLPDPLTPLCRRRSFRFASSLLVTKHRAFQKLTIDKANDVDSFGGLDFDLGNVVRFDYGVTVGFVLVTLGNLIVTHYLATLLATFVVSDRAKVFAVELIEGNLLASLDGVVNPDGDGDQQEANVTFPN
jgi:hypothetical protein